MMRVLTDETASIVIFSFPIRMRVVIDLLDLGIKLDRSTTYLQRQAWILVQKMIDAGEQDLARALDLELEGMFYD